MATAKKTLVIVESPSKAKTIGKYLGSAYKVIASVGHVRDLPKSKLGIDIEHDFEPQYIAIRGKGDLIKELRKESKAASKVYLATDPDREGEAIAWHLAYLLDLDVNAPIRITFQEITKEAIKAAIKNPRPIDLNLVDAQQARRVLDRLVGYQISPLLWRKIQRGLSAGRVQSAALKIICDRERQIQAFVPREYWTIQALFEKERKFTARLAEIDGKKAVVENKAQADQILADMKAGTFCVTDIQKKDRNRRPFAPFTTSTLQQDAANKLGFTTRKTMMIAQQLYEGVEVKGQGTVGLVTYIRTDSVRISAQALAAAKSYIETNYGPNYVGSSFFSNKKKDIQDAHEAIRPSRIELKPEAIKDSLTPDQFQLYRLIWTRFLASRMADAVFDSMQVNIRNGRYDLRAVGSRLRFDGFLKVYNPNLEEDKDAVLPPLSEGEVLTAQEITAEQKFTEPPARFTEASLVRDLEEKNIGRPSTYAPIIATILDRKYVRRQKKTLIPTELGFLVTELMETYFKEIVDTGFTAGMEDKLDDVEAHRLDWKQVVRDFYGPLEEELAVADAAIEKVEVEARLTDEVCPLCGRPMAIKTGRYGEFLACTGYPDCKYTKPILKTIGVRCPDCGGEIVARRSKAGKTFYGCSNYPTCTRVYWYRPVNRTCPKCGALLVKRSSRGVQQYSCSNSQCDYRERGGAESAAGADEREEG